MNKKLKGGRGVYFLANDSVLALALAFLKSFRSYNPELNLQLIPFDARCEEIIALKTRFTFDVYPNQELLQNCDRVSEAFHGKTMGHYRKLAAWDGEFEEFIYIDIDTVVLHSVD